MSDRDLTALDVDQLLSIHASLGSSTSDLKTEIVNELTDRLLEYYPSGMSPWYCRFSDEHARKHASWLPVYEIVKDSDRYQDLTGQWWK